MSSELWSVPDTWLWASVKECAKIIGGGTPSTVIEDNFVKNGTPWITPSDLTGYKEKYIGKGKRDLSAKGLASCGATVMPKGTVLFSSRAPIGYCAIAANSLCTNQGFKSLVLTDGFEPEFIRYYLLTIKEYAESVASGSTFKELSAARMAEIPVPVVPQKEQQRIVLKLDGLFTRSAKARDELAHIPRLIERYKQVILSAAFRGDLTADWRKIHTRAAPVSNQNLAKLPADLKGTSLPESWKVSALGELTENFDGKRIPVKASDRANTQGEYPYYGASGIIDHVNDFIFDGTYLLVAEDGANLVARATPIAFTATGRFWVNNHSHVLQPKKTVLREFLQIYLNWLDLKPYVTGSAQPKLTQAALNKLPVPVPDIEEQKEICRIIIAKIGSLEKVRSEVSSALAQLKRLGQYTLTKAFKGELVAQDPNDEPATALLARIQSQAATTPQRKRTGTRA